MTADDLVEAARALPDQERMRAIRAIAASIAPAPVPVGTSIVETEIIRSLESVERTMRWLPPGDEFTSAFGRWLTDAIGRDRFPPELAGDLAHLAVTIEDLYLRLAALSLGGHVATKADSLAQLWALRFDLAKNLLPIWRDIRNDLRATLPTRASELQ